MTTLQPTTSNSHRVFALDLVKAWSILGVVAIHAFTLREKEPWAELVMTYFRFGVPCFIIVSFYLTWQRLVTRGENIVVFFKRMTRLLVPYAVFSVFYHYYFHADKGWDFVRIAKTNIGGYSWPGQYYLVVLVQLTLVYYLICRWLPRISLTKAIALSAGLVVLCTVPLSYLHLSRTVDRLNMSLFIFYMPYLLIGCGLAAWGGRELLPRWAWTVAIAIVVAAPFLIVLERSLLRLSPEPYTYSTVGCIVASVLMCWILISSENAICDALPESIRTAVTSVSEHTLGIYCLNPLAIHLLGLYLLPHLGFMPEPAAVGAITLLAFVCCYVASYFVGNVRFLNYLTK